MHSFEFCNPTRVIFGRGTVQQVGLAVAREGAHKVLLIAGGGSIRENGVYQAVTQSLSVSGINVVEAWGVRPNPELALAQQLVQIAREQQVDLSLIHISEPTRLGMISYAVFCLKKK